MSERAICLAEGPATVSVEVGDAVLLLNWSVQNPRHAGQLDWDAKVVLDAAGTRQYCGLGTGTWLPAAYEIARALFGDDIKVGAVFGHSDAISIVHSMSKDKKEHIFHLEVGNFNYELTKQVMPLKSCVSRFS